MLFKNEKKLKESLLVFSIFLLLGVLIQKNYFEKFPRHIHGWAQCDRYALSKGFLKNNFNLFEGQTYVHNLQFPGKYKVPGETSITAVDLPIADYISAIIMKLTNDNGPWIFRSVVFVFGLFALLYFFKVCKLLGARFEFALLMTLLFFFSPVFLYYHVSLMPTVPSMTLLIIGFFHYLKSLKSKAKKHLIFAVLFLSMAALNRLTFVIPLFALFCWECYSFFTKKKIKKDYFIALLPGLLIVFIYWLYNKKISAQYGSLFLNELLYPKDLEQALTVIIKSFKNWFFHYFSPIHYLLFVLAIGLKIANRKKIYWEKIKSGNSVWTFLIIWIIGILLFSFLMLRQFEHHDYYFLDTYYIPLLLGLLILFIPFQDRLNAKKWKITLLVFTLGLFGISNVNLKKRYSESSNEINSVVYNNFVKAPKLLEKLEISKESKMLILNAYVPNMGLQLMDRKGFVVMTTSRENLESALTWNYDYIVFQNNLFLDDIYVNFPEIINKLEIIGKNNGISIAKLKEIEETVELDDFLGVDEPSYELFEDFESIGDSATEPINKSEGYLSDHGFLLDQDQEFGLNISLDKEEIDFQAGGMMKIAFQLKKEKHGECFLVIASNDNKEFYRSERLSVKKRKGKWIKEEFFFKLPSISDESNGLKIYLWNNGKGKYLLDDFKLQYF